VRAAAATLALAGAVLVSGCGGAARPQSVASVRGSTISTAQLDHWSEIEQAEARLSPSAAGAGQPRERALAFLITALWLQREAAARGIEVSQAEVQATYEGLQRGPAGAGFVERMARLRLSAADELYQLRLAQLSLRLRAAVAGGVAGVPQSQIAAYYRAHASRFAGRGQTLSAAAPAIREQLLAGARVQAVSAFVAAFRQRWKRLTSCRPGYVIAECANGPALANPAG